MPSRSHTATVVLGTHWLRLVILDSLSCLGLLLSCSTRVVFLLIQWGLPCIYEDVVANELTLCTENLQQALVVFKMYSLLHDLLSVCVSEEERVLWPWSSRHSEPGLQLEINPSFLQLTLALLQPPFHSQGEEWRVWQTYWTSTCHFSRPHPSGGSPTVHWSSEPCPTH